jgi:hypothetical protein
LEAKSLRDNEIMREDVMIGLLLEETLENLGFYFAIYLQEMRTQLRK